MKRPYLEVHIGRNKEIHTTIEPFDSLSPQQRYYLEEIVGNIGDTDIYNGEEGEIITRFSLKDRNGISSPVDPLGKTKRVFTGTLEVRKIISTLPDKSKLLLTLKRPKNSP